jgi:HlyD family secretion protein
VALAKAALEQALVNLEYTTITSPINGVVVSRSVDVGQTVAASLSAPTLFVIAEDLRKMEVHVSVAESDIGQIAAGTRADFTVDAFPDREFTGTVKQIRFEPQTQSNVVTYDAVVSVANEKLELRPGMTANVTFIAEERRDVLVVPNKALRYRPPDAPGSASSSDRRSRNAAGKTSGDRGSSSRDRGGAKKSAWGEGAVGGGSSERGGGSDGRPKTVWVLKQGKPSPVTIKAGLSDGTNTELVDGDLREGDSVIVGGARDDAKDKTNDRSGGSGRRGRGPPKIL